MVFFEGTKKDFKRFIGGYCRNKVQHITKGVKKKKEGICDVVGKREYLILLI